MTETTDLMYRQSQCHPTQRDAGAERFQSAGDRLGFWASVGCAVHCALLPVVLVAAPTLGLGVVGWLDVDQVFVLVATVLGVTMLTLGYRRHRARSVWLLLLAGLALVWGNAFSPLHGHGLWHGAMMAGGGLLIAWAHFRNTRLASQCRIRPNAKATRSGSTKPSVA